MEPRSRRNATRTATAPCPFSRSRPPEDTARAAACARGFIADLFVPQIASTRALDFARVCTHFRGVIRLGVGDIHDHRLHRGQPGRECTGMVLDQDADERSIEPTIARCSMTGMPPLAVLVHVLGAQPARASRNRPASCPAARCGRWRPSVVLDLRAVERASPGSSCHSTRWRAGRARERPRPCPRWHRRPGATPAAARS